MQHGGDINVTNNDGATPLHRAAYVDTQQGFETVKFLMEHVTDINPKNAENFTPFMYAVKLYNHRNLEIHLNILNYLIDKGVDTESLDSLQTFCGDSFALKERYASIIARLQGNQDGKLTKSEYESQETISNKPFVRANARTH